MIDIRDVENIHTILIEKFGSVSGIRDRTILDSAINRPFQTFDQKELYPSCIDKTAAIFESLISNHPFIDGNKRRAYVLMRLILLEGRFDIVANEGDKYDFVIASAKGELKFEGIRNWIIQRSFKIDS
ncbi:MAG: type II toxin-antitoxin system death-on-curing family toxin [Bacteroidetes bacterium]|nr:type II toxin-antitoxin system death-on-curing family toxin [Bacteroidota bacterium]MBI3482651.1 type II toxin-antitoxin system death-on-curing family toxin [Bacteroidota bacterium]